MQIFNSTTSMAGLTMKTSDSHVSYNFPPVKTAKNADAVWCLMFYFYSTVTEALCIIYVKCARPGAGELLIWPWKAAYYCVPVVLRH